MDFCIVKCYMYVYIGLTWKKYMSIAFDQRSLNAAANLVINIAAQKKHEQTSILEKNHRRDYNLEDFNEVVKYLMDKTEVFYNETDPIVVASIAGVPYATIGVVFERMYDTVHPAPPTKGIGKPEHIAYFWHAL